MKSRLDRNSTLRQAAWCALPALALFSAVTAPAAAGGAGGHAPSGAPHHIHPASSSAGPLALNAHLAPAAPVLRVAEANSFGYLSPSSTGILPMHSAPKLADGNGGSLGRRQVTESVASPSQGASPGHGQDAHATGAAGATGVILDNTLVTADLQLTNGVYAITPNFGKQSGGNLFFSFSSFSLMTGQTASFQPGATPLRTPVQNVLVRVTGNNPSNIDGQIACTIPNADFFFMNPAGVTFTKNASLNLQGSFYLTTADYIRFSDNATFAATNPAGVASLSHATPTALGFLASHAPSGITVNGQTSARIYYDVNPVYQPSLNTAPGKSLIVVGGDIAITGGELAAFGDRIAGEVVAGAAMIASVGSAGEARLSAAEASGVLNVGSFTHMGNIRISAGGFLGSDAPSGQIAGSVWVTAASVSVNGPSELESRGFFSGSLQLSTSGSVSVTNGGFVGSESSLVSGSVTVVAASVSVDGSQLASHTVIGGLEAGSLQLVASGSISVTNGGSVGSYTDNLAIASPVTVTAATVSVDGHSAVFSSSGSEAGPLLLTTSGSVSVTNGSFVGSTGGLVTVNAASVKVDGSDLASRAHNGGFGGPSGSLKLTASGSVSVTNGGFLGSDSRGGLLVFGGDSSSVTVNAASVIVRSGGTVQSAAGSSGEPGIPAGIAGQVTIDAPQVLIDGQGSLLPTGIFVSGLLSRNLPTSGWDLSIQAAQSITIRNGASVAADAFGVNRGGSILINGSTVSLASGGSISARSFSGGAGAGKIEIDSAGLSLAGASFISADNYRGAKAGGAVQVDTTSLTLDSGSSISATAGAGLAKTLTVIVNFKNQEDVKGDLFLTSPMGIRVQLDSVPQDSTTTYADNSAFASRSQSPIGFLSTLTAKDLDGRWSLALATATGPVTLTGWSLDLGGKQISRSTDIPKTGNDFSSTLVVSNVDPGLTGGHGGDVIVTTKALSVLNGSTISATTLGTGSAGNVHVTADNIVVSGAGSSIQSQTAAPPFGKLTTQAGNAGNVTVTANQSLTLQSGGAITTTATTSAGGDISVNTPALSLDAGVISATALRAGQIIINSLAITLAGGSVISTDTVQAPPDVSDVLINTSSLSLDNSTISAQTTGSGNGGNVQINPATTNGPLVVSLTNGSLISAATSGSGTGGSVAIMANILSANNSNLFASSTGAGAAGSISINTTGTLSFSGGTVSTQAGGNAGGISLTVGSSLQLSNAIVQAQTLGKSADAKGGGISLTAGTIKLTGGSISATAANMGKGGSVSLTADSFLAGQNAGVSASTTGSGSAGSVTLDIKNDATLNSGAMLSAGTSSSGTGSDVMITSGQLTLSGGLISADTSGLGVGGGVSLHVSGPIVINAGSTITASTSGVGAGGSVAISGSNVSLTSGNVAASSTGAGIAGSVTVDAAGMFSVSGSTIRASSMQTNGNKVQLSGTSGVMIGGDTTIVSTAAGRAGGISITSPGSVQIADSQIQAQTFGTTADAKGGDITISGSTIRLTGGSISATAANQAIGGNIMFTADSFTSRQHAIVSASTSGSGKAGSLTLTIADDATITGRAALAATADNGVGGDVTITAGDFSLNAGGSISTKSKTAGGNIGVDSRSNLFVSSSTISAEAGELGDISLNARQLMSIDSSTITARTIGKGGHITIDPQYVLLQHSIINGLASGRQDVKVKFGPTVLLVQSGDSRIESNDVILPPQTDVSGALISLPSTFPELSLSLAPVCAPHLEADFSSFVITGIGGRPPGPDGWTPDLIFAAEPPQRRGDR